MVISAAMESTNSLGTPYEGGYPDVSPKPIIMNHSDKMISRRIRIPLSLKATCGELYKFIAKLYPNRIIDLQYRQNDFGYTDSPLPNTDTPLVDIDFREFATLRLTIKENKEAISSQAGEDEADIKCEEFPIFHEEYFEDVEDLPVNEEIANEIKEEEKKKKKEKEEIDALNKEFIGKYNEYKDIKAKKFATLEVSDIMKNLEEILNSYETL